MASTKKNREAVQVRMDLDLKNALEKCVEDQRTTKSSYIRGLLVNDEKIKKYLLEE